MSTASPLPSLAGKNIIVMGLGHFGGGLGAAKWLVSQGALVTVTDSAPKEKLADSLAALEGLPITFKLGGHDLADLQHADLLVVNPAVDRTKSDFVQAAIKAGVPTTTEMNLFLQRCPAITVGITGSVGKSTTTALIYEALKAALGQTGDAPTQQGPRVFLGGNIGRSLLFDIPSIRTTDIVVLELSSFMLEETPAISWAPHIAVITNIFPNHLDRHGTMAAYTAAKQNILRFQKPADFAVLNYDHELVARWVHLAKAKVIKFSTRRPTWHPLNLTIPGEHNQSNASAAMAVLDALIAENLPLNRQAAIAAIQGYTGLPHRLQLVHVGHVGTPPNPPRELRFYNDSKATTPDASATAIQAFDPKTAIFIIGGYDKGLKPEAFAQFNQLLVERAAGIIAIGQTGESMLAQLAAVPVAAGTAMPRTTYAGDLAKALTTAHQWAQELPAQAIVLSPASASWDQFPNYEIRGEAFANLAQALPT